MGISTATRERKPPARPLACPRARRLTAFFRDPAQFDFLAARVLPEALARGGLVRLWSAGCASGEEAWSLAMQAVEALPSGAAARVLGTDIDAAAIEAARRGVYRSEAITGMSRARYLRWFRPDGGSGRAAICARLRRAVVFRRQDLLRPWETGLPFDAIFCRNVMIYLDREARRALQQRCADSLVAGGYLFLGRAEWPAGADGRFEAVTDTIFRKRR